MVVGSLRRDLYRKGPVGITPEGAEKKQALLADNKSIVVRMGDSCESPVSDYTDVD